MLRRPTISVIIPNYNNAQFITECIDSVFAQTYQPLECIVVDDGSTDNSLEVLNNLSQKYPKLRIFEQINSGPSVARNLGMKHSKGEYFAMLDADDYWSKTKLENQVRVINEINDENHIVTSHNDFINSNGSISLLKAIKLPPYSIFDAFSKNVAIGSCSSILFPRSMTEKIGGYNPILRGSEDQDFHFRAILAGYQFHHSENVDVHIRWHKENTTKNEVNNIFFHLLAFEMQKEKLDKFKFINFKEYQRAIIGRLGTVAYWAKEAKRNDIIKFVRNYTRILIGNSRYFMHFLKTRLSNLFVFKTY